MIYIIRHQEGEVFSNCLSLKGLRRVRHMARVLRGSFENMPLKCVHTCRPMEFKHIRPVQTASALCTFLEDRFSTFAHMSYDGVLRDLSKLADIDRYDVVIVWHHGEIIDLANVLCDYFEVPKSLVVSPWPDDNYDGCLLIDTHEKDAGFIHNFFKSKTKKKNLFFLNCLKLF